MNCFFLFLPHPFLTSAKSSKAYFKNKPDERLFSHSPYLARGARGMQSDGFSSSCLFSSSLAFDITMDRFQNRSPYSRQSRPGSKNTASGKTAPDFGLIPHLHRNRSFSGGSLQKKKERPSAALDHVRDRPISEERGNTIGGADFRNKEIPGMVVKTAVRSIKGK